MEELELKAKLAQKMLDLEFRIPYIKAEGKALRGGKALELTSIYNKTRPIMHELGLKLNTEIISSTTREIETKDKLVLITESELNFTWVDTTTGYSETKFFRGSWCNYDNYGFALGSMLTYFKRQYLSQELNIESDEQDASIYEKKHMTDEEKAAAVKQELAEAKKYAKMQFAAATTTKELDFAWEGLNPELKKDTELGGMYSKNKDRILITGIETATNEQLVTLRTKLKKPSTAVAKALIKRENELNKK